MAKADGNLNVSVEATPQLRADRSRERRMMLHWLSGGRRAPVRNPRRGIVAAVERWATIT